MARKVLPPQLAALDDETKAICAAWFGMMLPGKGTLCFNMKSFRPSKRSSDALCKLVESGVVSRNESQEGAIEYMPLVDCYPLVGWFASRSGQKRFRFPLTEKIDPSARPGFAMTVEGSAAAVEAFREAALGTGKTTDA